jgi:hypothetical protein
MDRKSPKVEFEKGGKVRRQRFSGMSYDGPAGLKRVGGDKQKVRRAEMEDMGAHQLSALALDRPARTGWLWKQSQWVKQWKKRWFVLWPNAPTRGKVRLSLTTIWHFWGQFHPKVNVSQY